MTKGGVGGGYSSNEAFHLPFEAGERGVGLVAGAVCVCAPS